MTEPRMGGERDTTRDSIITAAERAFVERGLFDTKMEDVARGSEVTRRTLYRYFEKKEDLAFEVACKVLERWNARQERIFDGLEGPGVSRLEAFLDECARYLAAHHGIMQFMGEFDFYFKDGSSFSPDPATLARYDLCVHESDAYLREILELGLRDRTIRAGIDVGLTVFTISNILWGYGQRIASRRKQLRREFRMDPMKLIFLQIELYVLALRRDGATGLPGAGGERREARGG